MEPNDCGSLREYEQLSNYAHVEIEKNVATSHAWPIDVKSLHPLAASQSDYDGRSALEHEKEIISKSR